MTEIFLHPLPYSNYFISSERSKLCAPWRALFIERTLISEINKWGLLFYITAMIGSEMHCFVSSAIKKMTEAN